MVILNVQITESKINYKTHFLASETWVFRKDKNSAVCFLLRTSTVVDMATDDDNDDIPPFKTFFLSKISRIPIT